MNCFSVFQSMLSDHSSSQPGKVNAPAAASNTLSTQTSVKPEVRWDVACSRKVRPD